MASNLPMGSPGQAQDFADHPKIVAIRAETLESAKASSTLFAQNVETLVGTQFGVLNWNTLKKKIDRGSEPFESASKNREASSNFSVLFWDAAQFHLSPIFDVYLTKIFRWAHMTYVSGTLPLHDSVRAAEVRKQRTRILVHMFDSKRMSEIVANELEPCWAFSKNSPSGIGTKQRQMETLEGWMSEHAPRIYSILAEHIMDRASLELGAAVKEHAAEGKKERELRKAKRAPVMGGGAPRKWFSSLSSLTGNSGWTYGGDVPKE